MADIVIEQRVTRLEEAMAALAEETTRLSREMREFKEEMREFKEEMREFKEESRLSRERSEADFKAYREKSEADLAAYRQEWRAEFEASQKKSEADRQEWQAEIKTMRREFNRKQGELSNKMGTLAEDLVAPSLPRILREVVPCPADEIPAMAVRVRRPHLTERGRSQEYDVVTSCGGYALFNETKSRLKPADVEALIGRLEQARHYFPEYAEMTIIGSLASLYVDPSLVTYANRQGILILATGDELMEVLNEPGLVLREF